VSGGAALPALGSPAGATVGVGSATARAAVLRASIRALGKPAGAPQLYIGPMAKQPRMLLLTFCAVAAAVVPADWPTTYRLATWTLGVCLAGIVVTMIRRLIHISRHLRSAPR